MKLLLISVKSEMSKGGIAVWTNTFLSKCEKQNIQCDLVNTEVVGKRLQKGGFSINFADEYIRTRRIFKDLRKNLRNSQYDVAHLNTSCGKFGLFRDYFVARTICKKNIPLILHFHCDIPYWIKNKFSRKYLKKLVSLSSVNLVLCENSRRYLRETAGAESRMIPNFVDESVLRTDEKEIRQNVKNVFFVGRVERAKGAHEIFEIARKFENLNFKLAGSVSDEVKKWEKPDNIELIGPIPHDLVIKCLDEADVFLFPSHSEGFSLALAEAMARGVPCIATNVGAAEEMLADGCGVIVPARDIVSISDSLIYIDNANVRRLMSLKATEKVMNEYSPSNVFNQIQKAYDICVLSNN